MIFESETPDLSTISKVQAYLEKSCSELWGPVKFYPDPILDYARGTMTFHMYTNDLRIIESFEAEILPYLKRLEELWRSVGVAVHYSLVPNYSDQLAAVAAAPLIKVTNERVRVARIRAVEQWEREYKRAHRWDWVGKALRSFSIWGHFERE